MSLLSHLFGDISFFEVCLALVALGLVERALYLLPETMVGEGGWLLDTGTTD
jgi:hypothetical protein